MRQGRTDAWIAHKLDIGVDELTRFKRDHLLDDDDSSPLRPADPLSVEAPEPAAAGPDDPDEPDLDDDADDDRPARRPRDSSRRRSRPPRRRDARADRDDRPPREPRPARETTPRARVEEDDEELDGEPRRPRRRRGRRGGRRHRARRNAFEATFDHGEQDGYGLWLDPAVVDNPVYSQHWAGHRAVTVTVEADAITIRRAEADRPAENGEGDELDADE